MVNRHFHHHRLFKGGDEERIVGANERQVILREDGFDFFDDLGQRDVSEVNQGEPFVTEVLFTGDDGEVCFA